MTAKMDAMMKKIVTAWLLPVWAALAFPADRDALLAPFAGFDRDGMAPVFALFQADVEGRLLLRKAVRKLGLANADELRGVFRFCEGGVLASPSQNGQFRQETTRLYRPLGEEEWRSETPDGLARLADPKTYPIVAERNERTRNFEFRAIAFMPAICIRSGLSVAETYLILYHELTHLAEVDPFDWPDIANLTKQGLARDFYPVELTKAGGELDAFEAQAKALQRLLQRVDLSGDPLLHKYGFLLNNFNVHGLPPQREDDFMALLLDKAGYAATLDMQLADYIMKAYNRAHSWWRYFEEAMAQLDRNLTIIDGNIGRLEAALDKTPKHSDTRKALRDKLREMQQARLQNRRQRFSFGQEQKRHIALMTTLDQRFPGE